MTEETTEKSTTPSAVAQKNQYLMPAAIVIAGLAIAGALFYTQGSAPKGATGGGLEAKVLPVDQQDHVLGPKNPDVYLIEYSDYQCPFCTRFHDTVTELLKEYDGRVAWVYRHFPLDSLHPEARPAALASECIAEFGGEDAFWSFTDSTFAAGNNLNEALYKKLAKDLGIDDAAFSECLASNKYNDRIQRDLENVIDLGGQGTPFTVLLTKDGQSLSFSGALPIDRVRTLVDRALRTVE